MLPIIQHSLLIFLPQGPRRVKEGQQGVLVSRLQVADKDTKGTPAWRAKYQIHGDTNNNFRITTDTETNEGLLYLEKPLDYENEPLKIVNISVENEIPLFSCKVETRGTSTTGLWKVIYGDAGTMRVMGPSTHQVTVTVEDVNEPPIFDEPNKHVSLVENVAAGHLLTTFTARDPDVNNTLVYKKGEDPAGWFTVDSGNGQITTIKGIDRESSFVNDNIYVVTVYAVDSGEPPMTGTATLSVHITDENDNVPILTASTIDMCQSQGPSRANITAVDLDQQPYSGPFSFKLHGDVKGQWKVDPVQGYSVNLVKENTVHSGHYELLLEVSDLQGKAAVHNLSVTVCNCLDTAKPNCRFRKSTASASGGGVLGIILFCILLLAGMLLLAFLMKCKKKHAEIPDHGLGQQLMKSNTEKLGNDCEVEFDSYSQNGGQIKTVSQVTRKPSFNKPPVFIEHASSGYGVPRAEILTQRNPFHWGINDSVSEASQTRTECYLSQGKSSGEQPFLGRNSARWSIAASSPTRMRYEHRNSLRGRQLGHSKYSADQENVIQQELLVKVLNKMLCTLQAPGEELGDYAPHAYAEEGDIENSSELDAISIPDVSFDPDKDLNLDLNFSNLASVCIPDERT
uniref:Cadherin domain-containing protein n=1 Tax=Monopterus albus TaxID=43700 RepID=A0A3Q3KDE9_MONAL